MSTLLVTTESSLPPNEHGRISGYLEIEVTRINFIAVQPPTTSSTPINQLYITKKKTKRCSIKSTTSRLSSVSIGSQQGVTVKFTWWGENSNTASGIRVRADKEAPPAPNNTHQQQQPKEQLTCSKVRYSIQTSLRLFLEYLRSCETLGISVSTNISNLPLGRAQVRLPKVFVRKFAANYVAASDFEHKSKIYALYAAQNGQNSKCGEFQLRFRIMFAPSAKQMLQEQLQSTLEKELQLKAKNGKFQEEKSAAHNKFFASTAASRKSSKTDEVVEAMMKIDVKLVAYLAGEEIKVRGEEEQEHQALSLDRLQCSSPLNQLVGVMVEERSREQQLRIYQRVNALKIHLEALTLQPAGTKYMELLEEDINPVFTVECQLPNELICRVPRSEMFHVMQFESGHFQSLTQCTRFAQDEEREIHLRPKKVEAATSNDAENNDNRGELELAFGQLSFAVWWRQPGTCLNEMLGMAEFDLEELYKSSLLEQCKCLAVKRRNTNMANLYFKIGFEFRRKSSAGEQKLDCNGNEGSGNNVSEGGDEQLRKKQPPPADAKEAKNMKSAAAAATTTNSTTDRGCQKSSDQMSDNIKASTNSNNNLQLNTSEFVVETTKVRLLKGLLYVSEVRHLPESQTLQYFLVCRRFWHPEAAAAAMSIKSAMVKQLVYQEQFSVLNDEVFLQRVEKKFLQLELWRLDTANNGNKMQPYGLVRLPLHQYLIAYRDTAITNHLCKEKLPVISADAWMPITSFDSESGSAGDLKCLLAIGSEEQILQLKIAHGLERSCDTFSIDESAVQLATLFPSEPLKCPATVARPFKVSGDVSGGNKTKVNTNDKHRSTNEFLGRLQSALMPMHGGGTAFSSRSPLACPLAHAKSATLPESAYKRCFEFFLKINRAIGIPLNPPIKGGKKSVGKRHSLSNSSAKQTHRYPPNDAPSVYVTFQAEDRPDSKQYKSHEGLVFATNIAEKSTQPVWHQRFRVGVNLDYLTNPQKRLFLKVWKKPAINLAQCRSLPSPLEDAMIGCTALDLSLFLRGQKIDGWFNVVDFNDRINGQLELQCQLIDDVHTLMQSICPFVSAATKNPSMENFIDQFETSLDLSHLNIGQAVKRKYTELEQISQRLRNRLSDVTGEKLPDCRESFNRLECVLAGPLSIAEVEVAELAEFEQDLNTPPPPNEEEPRDYPTKSRERAAAAPNSQVAASCTQASASILQLPHRSKQ